MLLRYIEVLQIYKNIQDSISKRVEFSLFTVCRGGDQLYRCPANLSRNPYLKTFGEKCYQFNNYEVSWYTARDTCSSRGGCLVQIRTAQIQQFVMESLRSLGWNRNGVWMGAHDLDTEGHWKWVEGRL